MEKDGTAQGQKLPLESMSKDEIINKYKSLLCIAKKAKLAKDEISEENRKLKEQLQLCETQKEADKNALMTMKEMLEAYTESKLQLTTQLSELEKRRKIDAEQIEKFSIENESLKRQLDRLTDDNDSLLSDIEKMENQLEQVSSLGKEQKQHLVLLEKEINQLKEAELQNQELITKNIELTKSLSELKEKYTFIKEINSEQRQKFNMLKDRFIEVHKKLKKLKECKRILLETQHEYADSISQWQMEIIKASKLLCKELNDLKLQNTQLREKLGSTSGNDEHNQISVNNKLNKLLLLSEKAKVEYNCLQKENIELRKKVSSVTHDNPVKTGLNITKERLDVLWQLSKSAFQEYNSVQKTNLKLTNETKIAEDLSVYVLAPNIISKLAELGQIANKAREEYQLQSQELENIKNDYEEMKITATNTALGEQATKLKETENSMKAQTELNVSKHRVIEQLENDAQQLSLQNVNLKHQLQLLTSSSELESVSLADLKEKLSKCQQSSDEYHQLYKQKEREHYELLDEMRELNEALKARGDLISRQQEDYQLLKTELKNNSEKLQKHQQDLDEKDKELSEKQFKLNTLTKTVEETKQKLDALETASSSNEDKVRILNTELEHLRSSQNIVDLDNQSEILSNSTISRADELQRLKEVEDSFEDKYNKLRGLAAKLKKKLLDETVNKQQLEKELHDLKSHEKEKIFKINDLQTKLNDMEAVRMQLSEKQKQVDSLKNENQKLKSSRKQANVLNLEIEAAEKSLTDVTKKLAHRNSELDDAQESLKTKDSTISQLRKEIALLESAKVAEMKHSQDLKDQIDHLQKSLKDAVHSKQKAFDKTKLLEQDVENLKLELESVRVELANATSNLEKSLTSLKSENEQLSVHLTTTQSTLSECEQKLKHAERGTDDLRVEYLDYKVKAQAVLRKNQNRDSTKERELEEELLALRSTESQLKATIETLNLKFKDIDKEKNLLRDENNSLQIRCKELMNLVEEVRSQNGVLNQEVQQQIQKQHETLKQHRQQIESVDECHKEQIQSINTNHQRQLEQLRISFNVRLHPTVGATKTSAHPENHHQIDHQAKLDFLLMEREDAEGSEEATETLATLAASRKISNASSSVKRSHHDFMPLDELLNTPMNDISSDTIISTHTQITDNFNNNSELLLLELNATKEHLQKQESRVRHLTALLAENEQDLAKLTQMNDMLKEELRRQERSVEREQHMHNSEYIKNVIMKFLTLTNADEKIRLVPVLNTILKLSRTETDMLNCVAKGQKVSENTQRGGGWGNFLPWGGGGGGGGNNN